MAGNGQPFIDSIQTSLDKLKQINDTIEANTRDVDNFNKFVLDRLQPINIRINEILQKIKGFKQQLNNLQGNVGQNNGEIRALKQQIDGLTRQLTDMTAERDTLRGKLDTANKNNTKLQEDLNKLQREKLASAAAMDALRRQMDGKGDEKTRCEQAISELEKKHREQIEQINNENTQQIQELQNQINVKEATLRENAAKIADLERQLEECNRKMEENARQIVELEKAQNTNAQRIQELQNQLAECNKKLEGNNNLQEQIEYSTKEREKLQAVNKQILERMKVLINAINDTTVNLEKLKTPDKNRKEIEKILDEIEDSLNKIEYEIDSPAPGQGPRGPPPRGPPPRGPFNGYNLEGLKEMIEKKIKLLLDEINKTNNTTVKNSLLAEHRKYTTIHGNLNSLGNKNLKDVDLVKEVMKIFQDVGVNIADILTPKGGKKSYKTYKKYRTHKNKRNTRKNKQKGGFLYGKYKKTASTPRVRSTKNASSPVYSTNSKKNRRNRSRAFTKRNR
jgi:DNA repair exonuclease SbcCD ATPase subunit